MTDITPDQRFAASCAAHSDTVVATAREAADLAGEHKKALAERHAREKAAAAEQLGNAKDALAAAEAERAGWREKAGPALPPDPAETVTADADVATASAESTGA